MLPIITPAYYDSGRIIFASEFPFAFSVQLRSPWGTFWEDSGYHLYQWTKEAKEDVVGSGNILWIWTCTSTDVRECRQCELSAPKVEIDIYVKALAFIFFAIRSSSNSWMWHGSTIPQSAVEDLKKGMAGTFWLCWDANGRIAEL